MPIPLDAPEVLNREFPEIRARLLQLAAALDRSSSDSFRDYFRQLTDFEPRRAAAYGISHFTWICINAKEAENVPLARDVIRLIPEFLELPGVLGIGEIGLNKNTRNESII